MLCPFSVRCAVACCILDCGVRRTRLCCVRVNAALGLKINFPSFVGPFCLPLCLSVSLSSPSSVLCVLREKTKTKKLKNNGRIIPLHVVFFPARREQHSSKAPKGKRTVDCSAPRESLPRATDRALTFEISIERVGYHDIQYPAISYPPVATMVG